MSMPIPDPSLEVEDEAIVDVVVCGGSVAEAADASGLPEREVRRRLATPALAAEVVRRIDAGEVSVDGAEAGDQPAAQRRTSAAQVAANRRNALLSTGPKTEAGKRQSSLNAVTHGAHAEGLYPIPGGLLAEDRADFEAQAAALFDSLAPRDAIEDRQAQRVIAAFVRCDRLDRFEALAIAGATNLSSTEREQVGDGEHRDAGYAAHKVLTGAMDQASKLRQRALQELSLALATYEQLVTGRDATGLRDD